MRTPVPVFFLCLVFVTASTSGQPTEAVKVSRPAWSLQLPGPRWNTANEMAFGSGSTMALISETVAVSLPQISITNGLMLVDLSAGRVLKQLKWASRTPWEPSPQILAAPGGNFIVARDNKITLYDPELEEIRSVELPSGGPLVPSPTGSVFGWTDPTTLMAPGGAHVTVLDSRTLKPTGVSFVSHYIRSITERSALVFVHVPGSPARLTQLDPSGSAVTLYEERDNMKGPFLVYSRYLTDSLVLAGTKLIDSHGRVLFAGEEIPDYSFLGMSRDRKSFALVRSIQGTSGDPPPIGKVLVHLYAWNGSTAHLVSSIDLQPPSGASMLTPDGNSVIIANSYVGLIMYRLDQ